MWYPSTTRLSILHLTQHQMLYPFKLRDVGTCNWLGLRFKLTIMMFLNKNIAAARDWQSSLPVSMALIYSTHSRLDCQLLSFTSNPHPKWRRPSPLHRSALASLSPIYRSAYGCPPNRVLSVTDPCQYLRLKWFWLPNLADIIQGESTAWYQWVCPVAGSFYYVYFPATDAHADLTWAFRVMESFFPSHIPCPSLPNMCLSSELYPLANLSTIIQGSYFSPGDFLQSSLTMTLLQWEARVPKTDIGGRSWHGPSASKIGLRG